MYKNSLTSRPHVMKLCRNALKTYWTDARKNGYDCVPGYDYIHLFVLLCLVLSIYISKRPKNDDLNLARWKKTKNRVLSDLLSIMSQVKIKSQHAPVGRRKSKSCSHMLFGASTYWVKLQSQPQNSPGLVVFLE